ncbi:MAG: hypothetical protein LBO67_00620 [Spirochaetaceae bacterium]|jgi:hypothetical protein|nr:hypothetical protein [Spirochaetaceae bacterium]
MDKKKAVYAHGELEKVRQHLGEIDPEEAVRVAKLLGGEVGVEQPPPPPPALHPSKPDAHKSASEVDTPVQRREDESHEQEAQSAAPSAQKAQPPVEDDPTQPPKVRYFDRIRLDRYMAYEEFGIKSPAQVFRSIVCFISPPPDYVNPLFVQKRINEYYATLEQLVISTRKIFFQQDESLDERLKTISPLAFSIVDIIRSWDIEQLAREISRLQANPRHIIVSDFTVMLQIIYKPLFRLDELDTETHIKATFFLLYQVLLEQENKNGLSENCPMLIGKALSAYSTLRNEIHYLLYPLLLKLLSNKFISYDLFFTERRKRYKAFLGVRDGERLTPDTIPSHIPEASEEAKTPEQAAERVASPQEQEQERVALEYKAVQQGLQIMETLFPKSGWKTIDEFPDIYPYFTNIFNLKHGFEFMSPDDPLLQVAVLMHVLQNMFTGMRSIKFKASAPHNIETELTTITNNWGAALDMMFTKEYLPRLNEYHTMYENAGNARDAIYIRRLYSELQWLRRLFFFPYYNFDVKFGAPLKREGLTSIYTEIRKLRRILTTIACEIDAVHRKSSGIIANAWAPYNFQLANSVSVRLNALLVEKKRTNALLIFFTLSIVMILDYMLNNENSWAYSGHPQFLLRSPDATLTEIKINTDLLFRQSLKELEVADKAKSSK